MARAGAFEKQFPFASIAGLRGSALEFHFGFRGTTEFDEQIAAHGGQQVIAVERRFGCKIIDQIEACLRTVSHAYGYCAIQLDNGRRRQLSQHSVEFNYARPIGFGWSARSCMASGDGSLKSILAWSFVQMLSALKSSEAAMDQKLVPLRAILIEEQDWLAGRADACAGSRGLNFHERNEAVDFRILWSEFGKNAAEAKRFFAKGWTHPVIACGGGVALVEDEIDDFED